MSATPPAITSRAQWGANPLVTPAGPIAIPTPELWLHHSAGEQFGAAGMRMLQAFTLHRPDAHYVDLEYTFVLDHQSCEIFESRGPAKDSAATFDHNAISHAICVMGNFQIDGVSDQLVHTLANLVAWGYEQHWWPLGFTGGHRDAPGNSTACPGDHLEAKIPAINTLAFQIHAGAPAPAPEEAMTQLLFRPLGADPPNKWSGAVVNIEKRKVGISSDVICTPPVVITPDRPWLGAYGTEKDPNLKANQFVIVTAVDNDKYGPYTLTRK